MLKRPDYYLYLALERLWGPQAAASFFHVTCVKMLGFPRLRDVAERNFRRVYAFSRGREPTAEQTEAYLAEMARLMAGELLSTFALQREPGRGPVPVDIELLPVLESLRREGRGAVLVTPHFGDSKMLFLGLARAGLPLHVMINRVQPVMRAVNAALPNLRFADFDTGAKYYLDALARNELVLLFTDMDFFMGGRTIDLFGAPSSPPHGPARLAMAAEAPILPVYAVRRGERHRLVCDEPIRAAGAGQEEVERLIVASLERFIGRYPAHWLIFHDPWDLRACAREARRQLRQVQWRRAVEGWGLRLTNLLARARICPWPKQKNPSRS